MNVVRTSACDLPQIDYEADRFGTWAWWAKCDCGWKGPARGTLAEAREDSWVHTNAETTVQVNDQ